MRLVRVEDFLRGHCVGAELIGAHFPMSPDEDAALVALGWHHPTPTDGEDYVRFWPDDVPHGPVPAARRGRAGRRDGGARLPRGAGAGGPGPSPMHSDRRLTRPE